MADPQKKGYAAVAQRITRCFVGSCPSLVMTLIQKNNIDDDDDDGDFYSTSPVAITVSFGIATQTVTPPPQPRQQQPRKYNIKREVEVEGGGQMKTIDKVHV